MALCEALVVENVPENGGGSVDENLLYYKKDSSIENILSANQYRLLENFINIRSGNNRDVLHNLIKMRPQLLVMAIPMLYGEQVANETSQIQMMDQGLLQAADVSELQLIGLEDAHERSLAVLKGLTDQQAVRQILQEIQKQLPAKAKREKNNSRASHTQHPKNKNKQDAGTYDALQIQYYFSESIKGHDYGGVQFRNKLWMRKIPHLIAARGSLICVGLDHLKTRAGLIKALLQLGYHVEPVPMHAATD